MDRPEESVVRDSLYNWLGFGNLNGRYWFIGREESISLRKCGALESWSDYFATRSTFDEAMDMRTTWEGEFGRSLSSFGTTTWHYQVAFLLALHGREVTSNAVKHVFSGDPQFCRQFSNHFSGEFLPCPKKSKDTIEPYSHIWVSVEKYKQEVVPGRLNRFADALRRNDAVRLVITYSPTFSKAIRTEFPTTELDRWDEVAMDPIVLSTLSVGDGRTVYLLETPFLGYGRIGYDAIKAVVRQLPANC